MAREFQAADVRPPMEIKAEGSATPTNDFGVIKVASGTTHDSVKLPDAWAERFVDMYCTGGNVHFAISTLATAEVDRAVVAAATDRTAGDAKVGGVLADGLANRVPKVLPRLSAGQSNYLIHEADAASTVLYVELSSG